jgi:lysophospholipase L1-like esterase
MKKSIIITIISIILLLSTVYADDEKLLIRSYTRDQNLEIIEINIISNNPFYKNYYLGDYVKEKTNYSFEFYYNYKHIKSYELKSNVFHLIDINKDLLESNTLIIKNNDRVIEQRKINFCNNNNLCEPCLTPDCINNENELVCGDCEQNSEDNYCNVNDDNVCDLDCKSGYEYILDNDESDCFEETFFLKTCEQQGGVICNDFCTGNLDTNNCCTNGGCLVDNDEMSQKECNLQLGELCETGLECTGESFLTNDEKICCIEGKCTDKVYIQTNYPDLDLNKQELKESNYTFLYIIVALILIISIIYYIKKNKLISFTLFSIIIISSILLSINQPTITGNVASESQLISQFPQLFSYNDEKNNNLMTALNLISVEFVKQNVEITPELLTSIVITLEKEIGAYNFRPVEEYGDYCSGKICTYKVAGSCRNSPYYGGCDYKGRGYIQATHYGEYLRDCGEECVEQGASDSIILDKCDCVGKAYCSNENCNPSKALRPEYAGRIFANFYMNRGLVDYSNQKKFYDVGWRINGGESYGNNFKDRANARLQKLKSNDIALQNILKYLNTGEYNNQPNEINDETETIDETEIVEENEINDESTEKGPSKITSAAKIPNEVLEGKTSGYYYLNPSFKLPSVINYDEIQNEYVIIPELIEKIVDCYDLSGSYKNCANQILSIMEKSNWFVGGCPNEANVNSPSEDILFFCVVTGKTVKIFENNNYVQKPLNLKFYLTMDKNSIDEISEFNYDEMPIDNENLESEEIIPESLKVCKNKEIMLFGDSLTNGAKLYDSFNQIIDDTLFENSHVKYSGKNSETALGSIERLQEIINEEPDVVLLWHGMNLGGGKNDYMNSYQKIIDELIKNNIVPVIVTPAYICHESIYETNEELEQIRQGALELIEINKGRVLLIDLNKEMKKDIQKNCGVWYPSEEIHPTREGQSFIANYVLTELEKLYDCNTDPYVTTTSKLNCPVDNNLNYFTVGDFEKRHYPQCITGENSKVLKYINEGFLKYPKVSEAGFTPLLFMTECFVESSSGENGCDNSIGGGICQVDVCPKEYPKCREDSEAGKRQNVLAAVKELDEAAKRVLIIKEEFSLDDRQVIELIIFTYNRGLGTLWGYDYGGSIGYLKGVRDYLNDGLGVEDSMLTACFNYFDAGKYGTCLNSAEKCCETVGGLSYVKGTIWEYENRVCPTAKKV